MPILEKIKEDTKGYLPTTEDLNGFKQAQKLAYAAAEATAAELKPGMTEKQAAKIQETWLLDNGVSDWLHAPFAWFGDRTAFQGFRVAFQFLPTNRRLEENMPYILDNAPVVDGFTADIGYAGVLGENRVLDLILDDLLEHRNMILSMIKQQHSMSEVSQAVDRLTEEQGHNPRHKAYPFEVLAHQVTKMNPRTDVKKATLFKFGTDFLQTLGRVTLKAKFQGWSPLWNSKNGSNHPPIPGLWAVEPHLGFRGVGAKFEELLVITQDDAFWLDDDVPHVQRWKERGLWSNSINAPAETN